MSFTKNYPTDSKKYVIGAEPTTLPITQPLMTSMDSTTSQTSSSHIIHDSTSSTNPNTERNYLKGIEAREALMRGVFAVYDAVAPTIGPKGRDALLGAFEWPYSIATNDGASIAERVKSENPYEQMGVRLMQESIGRANKESGDGSTTTCILTASLLKEGSKYQNARIDFKEEFNKYLPSILASIEEQIKPVSPEEVWKVATISAQDEQMGKLIGEIYQKIGKDGIVFWEAAAHDGATYEIKDGVELKNVGFVHRAFINANAQGGVNNPMQGDRIVINNPRILISAEKISSLKLLEPYISGLRKEGISEMVLFCDEIEPLALAEIELNGMGMDPRTGQPLPYGPFKVIVLRAPTLWKDWVYEDFATMTGATIFGVGQGAQFKGGASLSWLGTCEKIIARRGGTDVIGTKNITDHIAKLKEASYDHRDFEKRVEWLNSKSAIVKMGAKSEVELTYKRLKFDDARNAAKLALRGGIVVGGGLALAKAAASIDNKIIRTALCAPMEQIVKNMGHELGDMTDVNDPADVVKNAVKAAISVAGTVLNCETLIPHEHTKNLA